jgi:hypothetical protein
LRQLPALAGVRRPVDQITGDHEVVYALATNMGQGCFKGGEIAVNVGKNSDADKTYILI